MNGKLGTRNAPCVFKVPLESLIISGLSLLLCIFAAPSHADQTKQASHPVSIQDVLKIEGIGDASFSPDGRWLAYNLVPPYDQLSDYSYNLYAYRLSGHRLWIVDLHHGQTPKLQPGLDLAATNYLFGYSPDSRHIITMEHRLGDLSLVACRIGKNRCVRFSPMPDIQDMYVSVSQWNERLVWTSDETFLMPTRGRQTPGSEMRARAATGKFLWTQWNAAWSGKTVTASEVRSTGGDRAEDWATGNLTEFNVRTGKTRTVITGRFAGARLSRQGTFLAAAKVGERVRPPSNAQMIPRETHPAYDRRYALKVFRDGEDVTPTSTVPFMIDPASISWSAIQSKFSVFGWNRGEQPHEGTFYVIDVERSTTSRIDTSAYRLANTMLEESGNWSLGPARTGMIRDGVVAFARPLHSRRYDWYLFKEDGSATNLSEGLEGLSGHPLYFGDDAVIVSAERGIYELSTRRERRSLISGRTVGVRPLTYESTPSHAWANSFRFKSPSFRNELEPTGVGVVKSDAFEGDVEVIFLDYSDVGNVQGGITWRLEGIKALAASASANAAVVTRKIGAATVLLLMLPEDRSVELVRINEHLNSIAYPEVRSISYELVDPEQQQPPRQVVGCVMLPPGYSPERRYPILIEVYPSATRSQCNSLSDHPRPGLSVPDLWTARGYVHIRPIVPRDLARTLDGPIAGAPAIVDQTIDALVEQGYGDPNKVVLFGFSQGGVMALYVAASSKKLSAVISMNGWADFLSHYFGPRGFMRYFHLDQNGGDNRWRYDCVGEGENNICPFGFGRTALSAPEMYARQSPVALAENISAPVLLVHSDFDYIDMSQYDEMFGALYRAGKEARYVRYWGEGHGPSSPANIQDFWQRIDEFLYEGGVPQ